LNLITGQLSPVLGTVSKHPALKLAKYSQHSADQLPYDKSPVEHLEATYKAKYPEKDIQYWRQQVGRFGVTGAHQTNPIAELSDGLRNVSNGRPPYLVYIGIVFTLSLATACCIRHVGTRDSPHLAFG
jgi:hypothetical protein